MANRQRLLLALIGALWLGLLSVRPAGAHGSQDTLVVQEASVGPYRLTAWLSPLDAGTGKAHFTALVAYDGTPVPACRVTIELNPLDDDGPAVSATTRPASFTTQFLHEADLTLAAEGRYEGQITVRDPTGNGGQAFFNADMRGPSRWMVALIYIQLLSAPLIGFYLLKKAVRAWWPSARKRPPLLSNR